MKFYAIVLTAKNETKRNTLYGYPQTVVFDSIEAAQKVIFLECLDESFETVHIIEIGVVANA